MREFKLPKAEVFMRRIARDISIGLLAIGAYYAVHMVYGVYQQHQTMWTFLTRPPAPAVQPVPPEAKP